MADTFKPAPELQLFCRFCKATLPAQLERSIADSGRSIDKAATFEYICPKCQKSQYYFGKDIIPAVETEEQESTEIEIEPRDYSLNEHFLIGEKINHPSFKTVGTIVGKKPGNPSRLLVKFEKTITPLVEGID